MHTHIYIYIHCSDNTGTLVMSRPCFARTSEDDTAMHMHARTHAPTHITMGMPALTYTQTHAGMHKHTCACRYNMHRERHSHTHTHTCTHARTHAFAGMCFTSFDLLHQAVANRPRRHHLPLCRLPRCRSARCHPPPRSPSHYLRRWMWTRRCARQ